jgi:hypothetical protein
MAESLDVSARLAEGRPAVDNIGDYVWACHLLGYQNADLTLHPAQVRDWYSSEDGLDLRALDADRAALDAAASAALSARQLQEQQLGALSGAWQGRGGDATHEFLVRHGGASSAAASAVRDAVDALTALRDELWRTVDEKVGTAVAIDDRRQAERPQWLAATQTVTTGAGDRAEASELIDQQVKPFVDNDIRSDWVVAMQKAMAAIAAAFDAATGALTTEPSATFDVPGDLGPLPPSPPGSASTVETAGTAPAGWPSPPSAAAPAVGPMTAPPSLFPAAAQDPVAAPMPTAAMPAPVPAAAPAGATAPAMPTMPSLGDLGGGLTGGAGGLAGLGQQIADAIGGLLDQPDNALPDPPDVKDDPADDAASPSPDDEDPAAADDEPDEPDEKPDDPAATTGDVSEDEEDTCTGEPVVESSSEEEPAPTPPPEPIPSPPPIVEPQPAQELAGVQTPCEIAADELPQAGP